MHFEASCRSLSLEKTIKLELILKIKFGFPTNYKISKKVISIAIPKLEYFYSCMVEITIFEECPTKINRKCSYNKSNI